MSLVWAGALRILGCPLWMSRRSCFTPKEFDKGKLDIENFMARDVQVTIGSQPSDDACAEHFLDEYSAPSPRSYSSRMYIHANETPSPPSAEIADGLRRLFTLQPQQEESGDAQGQELYHPDNLPELAQFLWQLADGNVRENPGLDDEIWTKLRELLPSNSSEAEKDMPADDEKIKSFDGHRLDS